MPAVNPAESDVVAEARLPASSKTVAPVPTVLEVRVVTGAGGGPDKTILNTPKLLDPAGFRTICAYMHPPGDSGIDVLRQRAESAGVNFVSIPDRGPFDYSVVRELTRLCRAERVAIWHGHDYKSNVLGWWIRRQWPMRLVSTAHGWVDRHWKAPLYDAIDRWALRAYERVICVSDDLVDACLHSGVRRDRLRLLENGIDVERFRRRQTVEAARRELGWQVDGLCLAAIGRLSDEKGFDLLIEAVQRLQPQWPGLRLVIAGEGPRRAALQALIDRHRLGDAVRLLGFCEDVRSLLEAADIFVLSSRREGLPNVVLEAMAMETPVVATRVAGVPQVITDGFNGLIAETGSVESLAAAIDQCLRDGELRRRLAGAARESVVRNRSFTVRVDRLRKVYEELLASPSPAGGLRGG